MPISFSAFSMLSRDPGVHQNAHLWHKYRGTKREHATGAALHVSRAGCHASKERTVLGVEEINIVTRFLDYSSIAPEAVRPLFEAGKALANSGLEPALLILVELRASQINGCAFCLALHTREAQAIGESSDRLAGLPAWREASWYSRARARRARVD